MVKYGRKNDKEGNKPIHKGNQRKEKVECKETTILWQSDESTIRERINNCLRKLKRWKNVKREEIIV